MRMTLLKSVAVAAVLGLTFTSAQAGDREHTTINRVADAYGIDKLKTIRIYSDLRFGWIDQGYTPGYVELPQMVKDLKIDLEKGWGSEESWGGIQNPYTLRDFNTDDGVTSLYYGTNRHSIDPEGTYYRRFHGEIKSSDTLLAYELSNRKDETAFKDSLTYKGRPHTVLTLSIPNWAPMDLYIDDKTGYITKMERDTGGMRMRYQFADFRKTKGVTYAQNFDFYVDDFFSEYAKERWIEVNKVKPKTFTIDRGMPYEPERVDTSEMTVEPVGNLIHHVGQGGGYSAFIDAGDHVIAVGGNGGFKERYEAYAEALGEAAKPLRTVIATHHHGDHLAGMSEAKALGSKFIVPKMAVESVKRHAETITDADITVLTDTLDLGPVQIHNIATNHVGSFALVYVPSDKTIFQVDHYTGRFKDAPSYVNPAAYSLYENVQALGLDVDYILDGHGRKAEPWSVFQKAVDTFYVAGPCPSGRKICRDAVGLD